MADLNTQQDVPGAVATTPPGMPQTDFERLLAQAISRLSHALSDVHTDPWLATYRSALPRYEDLPKALSHGELELFERYVGRRGPSTAPPPISRAELRLTRFVQLVEALPWHLSNSDDDQLRELAMIITEEVDQLDAWS